MPKRVVQCRLRHPIQGPLGEGHSYTTGWVEYRPDLRVGRYVELDDDPNRWELVEIGRVMDSDAVNRDWHVGGL